MTGMTAGWSEDAPLRQARVNLDAFRHNVRTLRELVAPAQTMIAVKADAYGHGMLLLAQAALEAGASSLAALDIPAALELRAAGISEPIFAWVFESDADFAAAADADIDLGISATWQLERIVSGTSTSAPRVHLKVDTGLSRNGATVAEWPGLVQAAIEADAAGKVRLFAAWSHLADASPADDAEALSQFRNAVAIAEGLGARFTLLHLAASSAGIRMPEARLDLVRFGIAAYGISPFEDRTARELDLRPVMTFVSAVASTKRVPAGHGVSYGMVYRTTEETTLALVPVGYADGVPRAATGRAEVWISGRRHPVVGRIAMDQFVVDVGQAEVSSGDAVVLFGEGNPGIPTAEEWARWAGTIGDEIVARIGPRVARVSVTDEPSQNHSDEDTRIIEDPEAMHAWGVEFSSYLAAGDLLVLTGELGAGKTTFVRGLGEGLGVRGPITSPTFVLARTHPNLSSGIPLVHIDAYRLNSAAELDDLDIDFAGSIVVVEWGKGLIDSFVENYLELVIDRPQGAAGMGAVTEEEEPVEPRTVTLRRYGPLWSERKIDGFSD